MLSFYRYVNALILRSKFLAIIFIVLPITALLLLYFFILRNENTTNLYIESKMRLVNSFLISAVSIFVSLASAIIFSNTKQNNVDLYLYVRSIKKYKIVFIKQLSLYSFGLLIGSLIITGNSIMFYFSGYTEYLPFFFKTIGSLCIFLFFIVTITTFMGIYLKAIGGTMFSIITLFIFSMVQFIPIIAPRPMTNKLTYNMEFDKNNYVKVIDIDSWGELKTTKGIIVNEKEVPGNIDNVFTTKHIYTRIDFSAFLTAPFEYMFGLKTKNSISLDEATELSKLTDKHSYSEIEFTKKEFSGPISKNSQLIPLDVLSPIELTKEQFWSLITNAIDQIFTKTDNAPDAEYWALFNNSLMSNEYWIDVLDVKQIELLKYLIGLKKETRILWYLTEQWNLLQNKVSNFQEILSQKYSSNFAEFLINVLTSDNSRKNIRNSEDIVTKEEIRMFTPLAMKYDEHEEALESDFEYIKDKHFYVNYDDANNIVSIQAQSKNGTYKIVQDHLVVFGKQMRTKSEWEEFIDNNKTIINMNSILNKVNNDLNSEMASFTFAKNVFDPYSIDYTFEMNIVPANQMALLYLIMSLVLTACLQLLIRRKVNWKDVV